MTPETVMDISTRALEITIVLVTVILLPGLAVGVLVSVFQAATQINETTLSFVPKLLVTFLVLMLAGPWMLELLTEYMQGLISDIPSYIG